MSPESKESNNNAQSAEEGYQVVARRYRPKGFDELIGQHHVAQALSNAITTNRVGHAYLFTGARGVGKTSTARIFAKSLNCVCGPTPHPCNECEICDSISTGEDVDVLEIDGASNRGIDEIRQLRQNASIRPSRARYKIYIIDEVHMLTREAFNALLKTLEEPPKHVKFIFCTTEANKIPITILSRCQRFDFAGIDSTAISDKLAQIAQAEHVGADDGVFETLARRAAGSMRDAQSLLEQLLSFAPEHIRLSDVHEMLGTADDQRIFRLLDALQSCQSDLVFEELDSAAAEGVDYGIFLEQVMGAFRDLMVVSSGGTAKLLLYSNPNRFEQIQQLAKEFGVQRILAALQILDQTHNRMRFSTQGRILIELAFVRIAHLQQMQSLAVLLEQLKSGQLGSLSLPAGPPQTMRSVPRIINLEPPSEVTSGKIPAGEIGTVESRQIGEKDEKTQNPVSLLSEAFPESVRAVPAPPEPTLPEPVGKIDLRALDDRAAAEVWRDAVRDLPTLLSGNALSFRKIEFRKPNLFVVTFPVPQGTSNSLPKSVCEKEIGKIAAALEKTVGTPIQIRFETVEVKEEKPQERKPTPMQDSRAKGKMIAELNDHPMIAKAREMFGADLVDVRDKN